MDAVKSQTGKVRADGFTLIELLVVIAIIALAKRKTEQADRSADLGRASRSQRSADRIPMQGE